MQEFATPTPIAVVLDIAAGRIRLVAGERADTTVEVSPADSGRDRDVKTAKDTRVACADGVLRIETPRDGNRLFGPSGAIEVVVHLPAASRLEAKAAGAGLTTTGRLDEVVVKAAQGPVEIEQARTARITLQDGDVTIGRLEEDGELTTARGDIRVTEAAAGAVVLSTQSGSITIGAAPETAATLDARTSYGRVSNALRNTEGKDAGLRIRATTSHGDISAHSN
ncbi:DUF4097 family beta strand repeat-containing protein [Streptomyces sp. NPDC090135]|uniref:DUF4097 family beta strand repeat-containing protein n=1 Tax=Streptomyces sp. NPDC090135 TaxID=3365957 RepID=UPI0038089326